MTNLPERAITNHASPAMVSALEHGLLGFPGYRGRSRSWDRRSLAAWRQSCPELAHAVGVHAGALYRLLRGIASVGVFAEDDQGRFTLTPLASLLLTDGPGSWRAAAILNGKPWAWQPWGALAYSVKTGQPAFRAYLRDGV